MREKLIKLLYHASCESELEGKPGSCPYRKHGQCGEIERLDYCAVQKLADHLITNGVTFCDEVEELKATVVHQRKRADTAETFICTMCSECDYEVNDGILIMQKRCCSWFPECEKFKLRPGWIPVTERLPEIPDGWAENPNPVLYMMKLTGTIYAGYYGENGIYRDKYFRQHADGHEGVDADDVLCWMWQHDLPEPPKEESKC